MSFTQSLPWVGFANSDTDLSESLFCSECMPADGETLYDARMQNKRIVLASRPTGMPKLENFSIEESEVPQPKEREVLVRTLYLSVDPYMRSRMNEGKSYVPPFEINEVITGGLVG